MINLPSTDYPRCFNIRFPNVQTFRSNIWYINTTTLDISNLLRDQVMHTNLMVNKNKRISSLAQWWITQTLNLFLNCKL